MVSLMVKVRLKKVGRPFIFKMNSRAWIISLFGMIAATLNLLTFLVERDQVSLKNGPVSMMVDNNK